GRHTRVPGARPGGAGASEHGADEPRPRCPARLAQADARRVGGGRRRAAGIARAFVRRSDPRRRRADRDRRGRALPSGGQAGRARARSHSISDLRSTVRAGPMRTIRDFRLGAGVLCASLALSGMFFLFPQNGNAQYAIYEVIAAITVVSILWG